MNMSIELSVRLSEAESSVRTAGIAPDLLAGRFLCDMPGFEPHAGSPTDERDARGDHDLVFLALTKKGSSCARSHLGYSPQVEVQDPSRQRTANSCR